MNRTKKMTTLAMLCAAAFIAVFFIRIPIMPAVPFLKYEPKDIMIVMGGFIYGPLAAFTVSAIVSLIEFISISETGVIGLVMNILSSCSFACVAAGIYKVRHTLKGAICGLVCGVAAMCAVMLLWNYLITPLYMEISREAVSKMLLPAFLPFNLLKGVLNAALTLLLYKPVVTALRKTGSIAPAPESTGSLAGMLIGAVFLAVLVAALLFIL
ncbi:MAG: ECF transporter S component [Clostridia bacterium]|nr:ECF transporter S component [Clostridia bacterium]